MSNLSRTHARIRTARWGFLIPVLMLAACGPRERAGDDTGSSGHAVPAEQMQALLEESEELEQQFDEQVTDGVEPSEEQISLLEDAWVARRDYVAFAVAPTWGDRERLRLLEAKLATARSHAVQRESDRLETRAGELVATGKPDEAVIALQEALRLQQQIDAGPADASVKRPERETALRVRIDTIEASSLAAEVVRLSVDANAAALKGDVPTAQALLARAMQLQQTINDEHPRSPAAGASRLERLRIDHDSAGAVALGAERDRFAAQALARSEGGRHAEAALLYGRACEVQLRINAGWPGTAFADPTLPSKYERLQREENAAATP